MTGVAGGDLKGTFNPSSNTWQATMLGAHLETSQFLDMIAAGKTDALQKLNIPSAEIGRATLNGSSDLLKNVQMKDVTFFAYNSGGSPRIWATKSVTGDIQSTPAVGHSVGLERRRSERQLHRAELGQQQVGRKRRRKRATHQDRRGQPECDLRGRGRRDPQWGEIPGDGCRYRQVTG